MACLSGESGWKESNDLRGMSVDPYPAGYSWNRTIPNVLGAGVLFEVEVMLSF